MRNDQPTNPNGSNAPALFRNRAFSNALYTQTLTISERRQLLSDYGISLSMGVPLSPIAYEQISLIIAYLEGALTNALTKDDQYEAQVSDTPESALVATLSVLKKAIVEDCGAFWNETASDLCTYDCPFCDAWIWENDLIATVDPMAHIEHDTDCPYTIAKNLEL